ncbi:3-hydroxyacyl-CoA dehydrogenase NAD-binding domain-containing protein [Porticoccus litoralis]|uniref:enoyl-CoA hydratase n=1 Tax=Porticoccus litoralis TaxID=434086 RepID=A0AAW8B186_9GAMM|nr:3-hydroxyacyl-CoA dehydrogenase NAD-binding domain-containing protein [Porticoccus litoralis]MDP1520431.1 3-hydroxyacyl-CoA dehydrogenase NAD-binding domain-containing protein [Porticoccus litoralis]
MTENTEFRHWQLKRDAEDIAWLVLDREGEKVNSLSREVLLELDAVLAKLEEDLPRGLVIYSAKKSGFIAGADIREFDHQTDATEAKAGIEMAHKLFDRLEALPCYTVASIHGFCLGGGLELALACDYRVALDSESTRIGFPEIQLGIFPAFGGTARSIRLLGGRKALELILTARSLRARAARGLGLVDKVVSEHGSLHWAARKAIVKQRKGHRASRLNRMSSSPGTRQIIAKAMEAQVSKRARRDHYPAPYVLIDLWRKVGDDFNAMLKGEAEKASELLMGDVSRNLRRVFRLQEQLKELAKPDDSTANWQARRVHVVGAGVMGGDIAAWCALRGLEVTLQDREMKYVAPALKRAEVLFKKKLRSSAKVAAAKSRLMADVAGDGIQRADVIIEAIFENLEAKQQLFTELEQHAKPDALLASNTSAIPLEDIAAGLQQPQRLIGLHFFNPVAKMPLVEVVRGSQSDSSDIKKGCMFSQRIGKFPLPVKSAPGFLVNRVLAPYMLEAVNLLDEGHSMATIDAAAETFGMPMGPIELVDTVGLDVAVSVSKKLAPDNIKAIEPLQAMVDAGKLGKKSGEGFYLWKKDRPEKGKPSDMVALDILGERLIKPLLEECRRCLAEDIVDSADLLDAGVIFGTGFAPFRGGPMHYLEESKLLPEVTP